MAPRKKAESKPRISGDQRKDWRNLPPADWNTLTVMTQIIDLNRERYGADPYIPAAGGWRFEQGVIKRALTLYGAEALRETIERAFTEHRVTAQYPQLTAGFLITYMLPRIMAQVLAEGKRKERVEQAAAGGLTDEEIAEFL
ncbi:hypothetical protein C162_26740 [Paenibacillus sp. FSL R7-269]|uniref:hypothetical protein n=1 Tax=Paenibacillus sp. FSL R7-269 TaxID=1226755 RepID=UPI0003E253D7|nr:hypothetical protein [Paenibacillus sp. FSL R7-269]ETT40924.1 hypothetical protein C162_26740 [Paenibacillus sp. FSL R7-269]